jgi:hypothetical protein
MGLYHENGKPESFSRKCAGIWKIGKVMKIMELTRKLVISIRLKIAYNDEL